MAVSGAPFLLDLALVTCVAAVTTLVFHRFKQPVVLGYLLAGVLIGPGGPLAVQSVASVQTLAELGIVFLMFSIGLEFRLQRLARAGFAAVGAALVGLVAVAAATVAVGGLVGWSTGDALFLGALMAISSTVIAAKAMVEVGQHARRWAELAMGVLIVQDVVAIALLALLGGGTGGAAPGVLDVLGILGRIATFAMAALVLGLLFVPRLVNRLARTRADEVLVVTLAALALGVAVLATLLGFSPALGAFLIGAVVAEASESWSAEQRVIPLRDLFTAIFFVSIGMLLDLGVLAQHWPAALGLGLLMAVVKIGAHTVPAFLLGAPPREAFKAGVAVAQIGEFSFVLAAVGLALGAVSGFVLPVTVAIAAASALWTPYLLRGADGLYDRLTGGVPSRLRRAALRYQVWVRDHTRHPHHLAAAERRLVSRALSNAGAVLLILLATAAGSDLVEALVSVRGLSDRTLALLPWLAGGVLALPFAFNAGLAAWALLRRALGVPPSERPAGLLRATLLVGGSALLVFGAFVAAAPFLPPLPLLLLSLAAFMGAAIVLWEYIMRLHTRVGDTLVQALGGEAQGDEKLAVLDALREEYRWGLEVERVRVEPGTAASVATVGSLDLRRRTGATLVAVQRRGHTHVNPAPGFVFEAGDALLLLGDEGQLERARETLQEAAEVHAHGEEPRFAQLRVEQGARIAGQTLAEAALRERTGATIVGILRGGKRLASPGAATRIEPGDVLLVVGAEEQLREAASYARERPAEPFRGGADAGPNV